MVAAGAAAIGPGVLRAGQPWLEKQPAQWTPEDTQAILNRSAWVREVPLEFDPGKPGTMTKKKSSMGHSTDFNIVVRWDSAFPVRMAQGIKSAAGDVPERYVITIGRIPLAFLGSYAGRRPGEEMSKADVAGHLGDSALIERSAKGMTIRAEKAEWISSDMSQRVSISFARQNPIELADGEVIVAGRMGALTFKARFPLKPMVYRDKLEL
jgi:hypothetical protein